ncbi:MAG: hypothetical protein V4482_03030 [Pseudomonadota bacterium]
MLRRPTFWSVTLAIVVGMVLFRVKYEVIALEQHDTRLKKEIHANKDAIHILKTELTHLNDPKSLQHFTQKYLTELKPVSSGQLITFHDMAGSNTLPKAHATKESPQTNALDAYVAEFAAEASEGIDA